MSWPVPARTVVRTAALLGALVGPVLVSPALPARAATADVPYVDPGVTGSIGLCDVSGRPVLAGKVSDKPFVWLAVGSTRVPAPYDATGRTAFLAAYQPRQGVDPAAWSGFQLATASRYTNPAHPMSQATPLSSPLQDFLGRYPAQWNGLVQLRLLVGGSGRSPRTASYDATDLRVTGDTWRVVRGTPVACGTGKAVSTSVLLHLPGAAGTPRPGAVAVSPSSSASVAVAPQVVGGRLQVGAPTTDTGSRSLRDAQSARTSSGGSTSLTAVLLAGGAAVLLTAALIVLAVRRRSTA